MLKIRLKRIGRRNHPSFRVVLVDSEKGPKSGKVNEVLGSYNPHTNEKEIAGDRVKFWIEKGAQVSDTVHNILVSEKIIDGKKINVLPQKSPIVKEVEEGVKEAPKTEEKTEEAPTEGEAETEEAPTEPADPSHEGEAEAEEKSEESAPEEKAEEKSIKEESTEQAEALAENKETPENKEESKE